MGEKYKNDDSSSEEEIWVPIKLEGVLAYSQLIKM
jgi:hypothetical protein